MNHTEQIISALYSAKSDNREKMLADLILNVLYNIDEPIEINTIIEFIKEMFHLEPISYEVDQSLNSLIESRQISYKEKKYSLLDISKSNIFSSITKGQSESNKRYKTFSIIAKDMFNEDVTDEEITKLWNVFNEYLVECFLVFGRKAINIFLPFKNEELSEDDVILNTAYKKLNVEKLVLIFKKIAYEYPNRINESELRYLTLLANRAEKFYSLGVLKEDYEKIKNLQIKDLVIFVDTNVLYSILNISLRPDKAAILEIIRLSKEKQIDLRIVYLPKTYAELQKAKARLELSIPKENFKISQIKAMLDSDKLDSFAKQYYENKLKNSDAPHPSETVAYASDILKGSGIIIYNNRFPNLEEEAYLNVKIQEYYEFQRYYNRICDNRGYIHHLNKEDKNIEHDIFLREAIKELKSKYADENELKYICLTLDKSLIHFDAYSTKEELSGVYKLTNPNFISPALFIRKIRPFIPITTVDYRKAFITSLTAPTLEREDDRETTLIQKSMTYFKNLGIEDEEIILNCIKRELFLEDFEKHENDKTSEKFIESEIANEITRLKTERETLRLKLEQKEKEKELVSKEREEFFNKQQKIVSELETNVLDKKNEISSLEDKLNQVIEATGKQQKQRDIDKKEAEFEKKIISWELAKEKAINEGWDFEIPQLRKNAKNFIIIALLTVLPIFIGITLKANPFLNAWIESLENNQWWVWGMLALLFLIELMGRAYVFDKDKVKEGWKWLYANFSTETYNEIIRTKKAKYEKEYIALKPKPVKESSEFE